MRVLGLETSCDETGVALYEAGIGIRAERLASQIQLHAAYGGVVPELASRDHIAEAAADGRDGARGRRRRATATWTRLPIRPARA